jgi:ATP-dependent helicase HrpA
VEPPRPLPPLVYPPDLPIVARREELLAAVRLHQVLVVCGETGSGKTTQLPKILLEAGVLRRGVIGHTQPRRIAARAVAARLTDELPGAAPNFVGFKVRFSDGTARATAIKVMTDGILLAEARHDPLFRRYDALIIDEAHERSLNIDFLLGYLRQLLPRRPDLKLIITSATIDPDRFAAFFDGAPIIEVSGRGWPIETRYRPLEADVDDRFDPGLTAGILAAIEEIGSEPGAIGAGDVLVFLPGEREIREAAEAIEAASGARLAVLPLYSRLAWTDQQRVFERGGARRVVLATNVAETSLTVPGIRAVVDSGLARIARYSARAKVLRLPIEPVSQASANQRQGRCGRVGPGLCIRLYSEEDYLGRPAFTPPEVVRTNLASVILQMEVLGLGAPAEFPFIDPPETRLVNDGYRLLQELEAVDGSRRVTDIGRTMARLPVDPRFARMLVAARRHGALREVLVLAAALSIQDPRERPADRQQAADEAHSAGADPRSDFLTLLQLWSRYVAERGARSRSSLRRWCAAQFLSAARMREWEDLEQQLSGIVAELAWPLNEPPASPAEVHRALLTGLLGSIGEKTARGDFQGARGMRFTIAPGTPLRARAPRWVMAASLIETQRVYARIVAAVEPAWIEAAARHLVRRDYTEPEWQPDRGVVTARETVTLYGLTLAAGRRVNYGSVEPEAAREIFVREALVHGQSRLAAPFVEHNARLRQALDAEEAALRRTVVRVDEIGEAAFFLARLPAAIHSLAAFERWRREAERGRPGLLMMSDADLRRPDAPTLDRNAFPTELRLAGNTLPVSYRFEPGAPDDGATVLVPEPLLPTLRAGEVDWGIPGWLEEKLTALIRGLPKPMRRNLVPAPDTARRCRLELESARTEPFLTAVAASLTRIGGEPVPTAALATVPLDEHLRLNLRIVDAADRTLAAGRDLAELRRGARRHAAARPADTAIDPWSRTGLKAFDFDSLPETVRVTRQGVTLDLHPALFDRGDSASLELVADAEAAARATRGGLVRLAARTLAPQLRHLEQLLAMDRELVLLHQAVGPAREFVRQIVERALERELLPPGSALPRSGAAFAAALERARPGLVAAGERLAATLRGVLAERRTVAATLATLPAGLDAELQRDVQAQLAELVYPGFVAATPDPWLDGLGRYLKAIGRRAGKLRGARSPVQWELYAARRRRAALERAAAAEGRAAGTRAALRWLVEEYGVQLFAQELRTAVPVSAKRLAAAFDAADAELQAP